MNTERAHDAAHNSHPIVYLFLNAPFGILTGFQTVTIGYLLAKAGVPASQIADLIALSYLPHTWRFLWAPVVDMTLTRKQWYVLAAVASGAGVYASGALPLGGKMLPLLTVALLVSNLAVTFLSMATESLMAYATPENEKGRAGGWFMAGNLGGYGLGGGAGLWLAENFPIVWLPGAVLGIICVLCCFALWLLDEPPTTMHEESVSEAMAALVRDLWSVARSRRGYLGLLICFLPIGTGAASNLFSAIATDWHASANAVAWANGVVNGIVSAAGCIVGGFIADRMDRKTAYALFGVMLAAVAAVMGVFPRTESTYVGFVTLYSFVTGFTYAAFSAVVLEAIGTGAAATKFSLFASLANMPIAYMTSVDGAAYSHWGAANMLYAEAGAGMLGVALFGAVVHLSRTRG
jgi:predicted MFS family arabinose efflux permease